MKTIALAAFFAATLTITQAIAEAPRALQVTSVSAPMFEISFPAGQEVVSDKNMPMLQYAGRAVRNQVGSAIILCYRLGNNRAADYALMDARVKSVEAALSDLGVGPVFKGSHVLCNTLSKAPGNDAIVQIHPVSPID